MRTSKEPSATPECVENKKRGRERRGERRREGRGEERGVYVELRGLALWEWKPGRTGDAAQ